VTEYLFARTTDVDASAAIAASEAAIQAAQDAETAKDEAVTAQGAAETAQTAAELAETNAEAAAAIAEQIAEDYQAFLLTPKAADPSVDDNGDPLTTGDMYFNTSLLSLRIYDGGGWINYTAATGITQLLEDTSPQLGGNLDLNGFTVGAATAADLTKLNALTATSTELNYVDGVTSAIQTQIDGKQAASANLNGWSGVAVGDYLSAAGIAAAYQPLAAALTSWAAITRATGFDTFATTPSSANLRSLITDESGSAALYFQGGDAGTPSAIVLTNGTGLPAAGVTNTALVLSGANQGPITGGADMTPLALSAASSGTKTIDVGDAPMQMYDNAGAHALAVDTGHTGSCRVLITNVSGAGAITTAAFNDVFGDPFTTTVGHTFDCEIVIWGSGLQKSLIVRANQ
jgi:hypothetical protein